MPSIERFQPLREGVHAFYYAAEQGALTQCILAALADKPRMRNMAVEGYQHVFQHHTQNSLAAYIVREALAANPQKIQHSEHDAVAQILTLDGNAMKRSQ